ncbi:MAG: YdgA family protein [Acidiferrobacterales bacterium]
MKRALTVISVVSLLLAIAFAAAPYWMGMQIESAINDAVKGMTTRTGITSTNVSFSRGWLKSEANSKILLPTTPIVIDATHRIEHGPLPLSQLLSGDFAPALALIKTTLRFTSSIKAPAGLAESLKTLPPVEIETVLDLSGNGTSIFGLASASHKQGETTISWEAGKGQMQFDRKWKKIAAEFNLPLLSINSTRGELTIKNIRLISDMYAGATGYMLGRNQLSVANFTMKPFLDIQDIKLSAAAQSKGQFVTIRINYGVKALQIAKNNYGPGTLNLVIRNLDAKSLKQYENDMNQINSRALPQEQAQMMIIGKTLELAGKLSRNNPEIELTKLSFVAPDGQLTGKAKFVVEGKEKDLSANPMLLLTAVKGSAELSIPQSLAKAVVMPQIQRDIRNLGREGKLSQSEATDLTPEALNKIAEEVYPKYLQEIGFDRWLVKQGDTYRFSMSVNGGQVTVNGAPLSSVR